MKPINEMTLPEMADFFEDEGMSLWAKRLRQLHDLTRWIPISERYPVESDADCHGYVLWWSENEVALPVAHYWDFTGVPKQHFTHWKRIEIPEAQP